MNVRLPPKGTCLESRNLFKCWGKEDVGLCGLSNGAITGCL